MQNKRYIGIDPDIFDIGIAVLENKNIETYTKNIGEALVSFAKTDFLNTIFRVEAGWLNQSNWHTKESDSPKIAAETGRRTGENHGSGKVIVQFLIAKGANVELVRPKDSKPQRMKLAKEYLPNIKSQEEADAFYLLRDLIPKVTNIKNTKNKV
jgi:hypothetical protein